MKKDFKKHFDIFDALNLGIWCYLIISAIILITLLGKLPLTKTNSVIIISFAVISFLIFIVLLIISQLVCKKLIELELRIKELEKGKGKED